MKDGSGYAPPLALSRPYACPGGGGSGCVGGGSCLLIGWVGGGGGGGRLIRNREIGIERLRAEMKVGGVMGV